jgi:hypothetical protein
VPCDLLENVTVVEFFALGKDDVNVQVPISDVAIAHHVGLSLLPKIVQQGRPLSNIEGNVVSEHPTFLAHCRNSDVFPYLPYFTVLFLVG